MVGLLAIYSTPTVTITFIGVWLVGTLVFAQWNPLGDGDADAPSRPETVDADSAGTSGAGHRARGQAG